MIHGDELTEEDIGNLLPTMAISKDPTFYPEKENPEENIYAIKARIQNLCTSDGAALTRTGEILINLFSIHIKGLYQLSDTLYDDEDRKKVKKAVRESEVVPSVFIKTVTPKKKHIDKKRITSEE
jgi:hypothetical protein